jgi:hypothetical protein
MKATGSIMSSAERGRQVRRPKSEGRKKAETRRPKVSLRSEGAPVAAGLQLTGEAARRDCVQSLHLRCHHPERMRSLSPGLRGTSYPGCAMVWSVNPEGVVSPFPCRLVNPRAWRRERASRAYDATLSGLMALSMGEPRVARASQPWAEGCNPFGIVRNVQALVPPYSTRLSDFGLRPSFGLRTSAFGLPPSAFALPSA